jgi:RNA polymerase sigma-70 factor, ECF subfamily
MRAFQPPLHDSEAFGDLYTRTYLSIYRFIYGMLGGPLEDVEDLTCETYMRAWNGRDRFHGNEHDAICWLFTIARHLVIDAHRKQMSQSTSQVISIENDLLDEMFPSGESSPENQFNIREQFIQLWKALHALPDEKREVLVLRYILGWRVKDIAELVHKEENTVSVFIRRSLEEVRQNWPAESEGI